MSDAEPTIPGGRTLEEVEAAFTEVNARNEASIDLLRETITELELALEDEAWTRLVAGGEMEFSRNGLERLVRIARIMAVKNPLLRRAVRVEGLYVFGQGFEIQARDDGVSAVVDRFTGDPRNREVIFAQKAAQDRNRTMKTDGNLFLRLFPDRLTGHTHLRRIPFSQVNDIVCDPDDAQAPWFYKRAWNDHVGTHVEWYPDWRLRRELRILSVLPNGAEVVWDTPVYHVSAGGLDDARFGLPELYSSIDWARAYNAWLTDMASTGRSLSTFAWKATGSKKARQSTLARLDTTLGDGGLGETNPAPGAGSVAAPPSGGDLTPIQKSGMMLDADNGKPFRLMVASATDLPDTILSGDPDQGNLATAKTLDRPTELGMRDRQMFWADVIRDLCGHALVVDARTPRGILTGATVERDRAWNVDVVKVAGEPAVVDVDFPPILEQDVDATIGAIATAYGADLIPHEEAAKRAMLALGVENVDDLIQSMADERDEEAASAAADATATLTQAVEALSEALQPA